MTLHEWRRELLTHRIREMNGVRFTVPGNEYCNYGAPNTEVNQLIKDAIRYLEADEFDKCERTCERAERVQIHAIAEGCFD